MAELNIPSIPNSDAIAWIIAPAFRCAAFVVDQHKINGTVERALVALANLKDLILVARAFAIERAGSAAPMDLLLQHQEMLGPWAQEIIDHDFHEVHVSMVVAVWSAIEVAVEDTVVLMLLNDSRTAPKLAEAGLDVRKQLTDQPSEATARRSFSSLERRLRQTHDAGPALCAVLMKAGLPLSVSPDALVTISELSHVRNCILHRGGIADAALVARAPLLQLTSGEPLRLGSSLVDRYILAVHEFVVALTKAAVTHFQDSRTGDAATPDLSEQTIG